MRVGHAKVLSLERPKQARGSDLQWTESGRGSKCSWESSGRVGERAQLSGFDLVEGAARAQRRTRRRPGFLRLAAEVQQSGARKKWAAGGVRIQGQSQGQGRSMPKIKLQAVQRQYCG